MRSPAAAIAWEFGRRHRLGLIAVAGYVLVLATIRLFVLGPGPQFDADADATYAAIVIVPLSTAYLYLLAVFTFGFTGDLAGRQSMYPTRLFTLPVTTAALAAWPMLYGAATVAVLWLATALLAPRASFIEIPVFWPSLFLAAFLAWTQALMWMPYGLRGLRVMVSVSWLVVIDIVGILAIEYQPSESLMVAIIVPQFPVAYFACRFAVARARRGHVPDWRDRFLRRGRVADAPLSRKKSWSSPARAQLWFEWRRHGWSLPVWVGILLPFELALLFLATDAPALIFYILLGVLLTPPVMAGVAAASIRKSNPDTGDPHGVTPFIATRPVSSATLVAAKLRMTFGSTLAAWLLVLVAIPLGLALSDTWAIMIESLRPVHAAVGTPRAVVFIVLLLAGLLVSTWKMLVQSLYVGLSGRAWLVNTSMALTLAVLIFILPIADWVHGDAGVQMAIWNALPWLPVVPVGVKISAAGWVAVHLHRSRLVGDRALLTGAAWWLVAVLTLHGVLVWFVATPFFPSYLLLLVAILAVPLARVSAAPLALAWNRHR